jgi:hypothetical protein
MPTYTILSSAAPRMAHAAVLGLTTDLLTDPASIFTILLLVGAFVLVVWFGRSDGGGGRQA